MKVEEAVKQVIKENSVSLYNPITPSIMNDKLDTILEELRITNERMGQLEKENKEIKEELVEQRKATTNRDQVLMETMRAIQEQKQLMLEVAATQKTTKKWWEIWKL
ncbi:DUF3967 domain-containing protein [Bacillus sp. AFS055030]|uniref:DUF3967 domain-containing protein n=1 Tax=Bacillus sp. AFS055030 TaxID=2033507 RepID=UPI000BFC0E3E|nr:DUF3967 domain-containing protein [Bacillus sp. AFS055030]PGL72078.1 hypothetical protein CN925_05920 [Bacillus sp. AFS055030]